MALLDMMSPIFFSIAGRYLDLPKAEIAQIYENYFKPENIYWFYYLKVR